MLALPRSKSTIKNKRMMDNIDFGKILITLFILIVSFINIILEKDIHAMAHAIQTMESERYNYVKELESIIIKPLENLLTHYKDIKEMSKKWHRTCNNYNAVVSKISQLKKNSSRLDEVDQELQEMRKQYLLLTLEYSIKINSFEERRRIFIMNGFIGMIFSKNESINNYKKVLEPAKTRASNLKKTLDEIDKQFLKIEQKYMDKVKNMVYDKLNNVNVEKIDSFETNEKRKVVKGYLFQKAKKNVMKEWKKKYFMLSNGNLLCFKSSATLKPKETINLLLCTVKLSSDSTRNFCFEIISPYKTLFLQADSKESLNMWITAIQDAIAEHLDNQNVNKSISRNNSNKTNLDSKETQELLNKIYAHDPLNKECVDCGEKNPTWISINFGSIMCLECSGIHRSLGTHISKIRSISLDSIDNDTFRLFYSLGNTFVNSVFLHHISPSVKERISEKLNNLSNRTERTHWIKGKYVEKTFCEKYTGTSIQDDFLESVIKKDIKGAYKLIIQGADINYLYDGDKSALHYAALEGDCNMSELLIQFGANINVCDKTGSTPAHYAARKFPMCIALLCKRGAKLDIKNNENLMPIDVALKHENADCVTVLRLASQAYEEKQSNPEESSFIDELNSFMQSIHESDNFAEKNDATTL